LNSSQAEREQAKERAEAHLAQFREVVAERKNAITSEEEGLQSADADLKNAEAVQRSGDADLDAAGEKKEKLVSIERDAYRPLKEATDGIDQADLLEKVVLAGTEYGVVDALMASLPLTLRKAPDARSEFDNMLLGQFEQELANRVGEQDSIINDGEAGKTRRAAAVDSAKLSYSMAEERLVASKVTCEGAEAAAKEGDAQLKAAQKAVKDFFHEFQVARGNLDDAKSRLDGFREGTLVSFRELRDTLSKPPPSVEEPAAADQGVEA